MDNSTLVSFTTLDQMNASEPIEPTTNSSGGSVSTFAIMISLATLTVIMNILILRAFHIEKRLRTYANQYVLNIAISDLLVGFIMAIRSTIFIQGGWIFGNVTGHVYLGLQNSILGVSVLGILAIGFDRYVATFYPIRHFQGKKKRIAHLVNVLTWVMALCFWFPMTTIWNLVQPDHSLVQKGFLWVNYGRNFYSSIAITICRFIIPIVIITTLYFKIYTKVKATRGQNILKKFNVQTISGTKVDKGSQFLSEVSNDTSLTESQDKSLERDDSIQIKADTNAHVFAGVHHHQITVGVQEAKDVDAPNLNQSNSYPGANHDFRGKAPQIPSRSFDTRSNPAQGTPISSPSGSLARRNDNRSKPNQPSSSSNNRKMMRTLALITVAFFFSWLPSSIAIIALDTKSNYANITEFVRWASYSNSLINPITYAIAQPLFRQTLLRMFRCRG